MVNRLKQAAGATTGGHDEAAVIALKSLIFLIADEIRLERFCSLSGMLEQDLKQNLHTPDLQGFVLDYLLGDEALLLEFAAAEQLKPEKIVALRRKLPGFAE